MKLLALFLFLGCPPFNTNDGMPRIDRATHGPWVMHYAGHFDGCRADSPYWSDGVWERGGDDLDECG